MVGSGGADNGSGTGGGGTGGGGAGTGGNGTGSGAIGSGTLARTGAGLDRQIQLGSALALGGALLALAAHRRLRHVA